MTREEILAGIEIDSDGQEAYTRKEVLQAMSEFAQQEAIAFAEWKGKGCRIEENNRYYYLGQLMTNEQLYLLFKTTQNG